MKVVMNSFTAVFMWMTPVSSMRPRGICWIEIQSAARLSLLITARLLKKSSTENFVKKQYPLMRLNYLPMGISISNKRISEYMRLLNTN